MRRSIFLAVLLVFVGNVCAADVTTGLRAWWKMDGPTDQGNQHLVADSSGNGYDMIRSDDVKWVEGGGLSFSYTYSAGIHFGDEIGAEKTSATAADMFSTVTDAMTVSFFINSGWTTTNKDRQDMFKAQSSTSSARFTVEFPNNAGDAWLHAGANGDKMIRWGAANPEAGGYIPMFGTRAMITITKDATAGAINPVTGLPTGEIRLYVNGDWVATTTHTDSWDGDHDVNGNLSGMDYFRIGGQDWAWPKFGTTVDNFMIFDRALDADDMWMLANPWDLDANQLVNMKDLEILVNDWLDSSLGDSDINKDGIVNFKDYAILLDNWNEGGKYYFDSVSGNDNNIGNSPDQAWQSLNKFNSVTFLPGDKIFFKAGSQWDGSMRPKGSGTAGDLIIVDAYGDITDENNKPRIDAGGNYGAALNVYNVEYWEINNLQFTNQGATAGAWRKGVSISAENFGTMRHIQLKNLYVHNVNSKLKDEPGAGIAWFCSGATTASRFDGILIEGCHVKTTDREGINGGNAYCRLNGQPWYPSLNVVIRGNFVEDVGANGIVPIGTDGCIVEYNKVDRCGQRMDLTTDACAGIWPWSCDNTVIQYNESSNVKLGVVDGQGFDSDWNCNNSLFQYNYSHDNEGGFILVCNDHDAIANGSVGNNGTVIRYNISQNDHGYILSLGAEANIYNNVIYVSTNDTPDFVYNWRKNSDSMHYYKNNIFYTTTTANFRNLGSSYDKFTNNCFYGNHLHRPYDAHAITTDPKLVNPGSGSGIDSLDGYKLQSSSPCIGAGIIITNNGGYDFWGNVLYNGNPDIGAEEKL